MLFSLLLIAADLGRTADGCPDPETSFGRTLLEAGESCPRLDAEARAEVRALIERQRIIDNYKPRPVAPALQAEIKRRMFNIALDGPALRFQWPAQRHPFVYCGYMNGKNSYGAYTGWKPFMISINSYGRILAVSTDNPIGCENHGYEPYPY